MLADQILTLTERLKDLERKQQQQSQFQYGADQRRITLYRRWQSDAARCPENGKKPA